MEDPRVLHRDSHPGGVFFKGNEGGGGGDCRNVSRGGAMGGLTVLGKHNIKMDDS